MPSLEALLAQGVTKRVCEVCGQEKNLLKWGTNGPCQFVIARANGKNKVDHVTNRCKRCKNARERAAYARRKAEGTLRQAAPEMAKRRRDQARARYHRRKQEDPFFMQRLRDYYRSENLSPERLARRRARHNAYRRFLRATGAAAIKQLDEVQRLEWRAELERAVVVAETERKLALARERKRRWQDRQQGDTEAERALANTERALKKAKAKAAALEAKRTLTLDELEYLEIVAPVPVVIARQVIGPILARYAPLDEISAEDMAMLPRLYKGELLPGDKTLGSTELAAEVGVSDRLIRRIFKDKGYVAVGLEQMDRLLMKGDVTLNEVVELCREWALLNNDPWPVGYAGMKKALEDYRAEALAPAA